MLSAAPRDASWYDRPNVYAFKVVHANNGDDFAMCMPVPLCESPRWADAREVPVRLRCRRRACAKAFAAADAEPSDRVRRECKHGYEHYCLLCAEERPPYPTEPSSS